MSTTPESLPPVRTRSAQLFDGFRTLFKSLWFLVSLLLYAVGYVFLTIGEVLVNLSGWGPAKAGLVGRKPPPEPPEPMEPMEPYSIDRPS